jgi:hypothetical protein
VSVYRVAMGLLLTTPWILFGVVLLGAASSTVGSWLGRRRRPYRVGGRPQASAFQARVKADGVALQVVTAGTATARLVRRPMGRGQADERRAA